MRQRDDYSKLPGGKFSTNIIGRADQTILSQSAAKEGQLAKTDGPGFALYPSSTARKSALLL